VMKMVDSRAMIMKPLSVGDLLRKFFFPFLAGFLCLCLGGLWAWKHHGERGLRADEFLIDTPEPTLVLRIENRAQGGPPLNAFLVHGFQCNKSMMVQLGKYLALHGVRAYLIDLPGHGGSPVGYRGREFTYETVRGVLQEVLRRDKIEPSCVSLVGHSFGAMIAAHIGLRESRFRSNVLIGPGYEPGLSETGPANLLLLTGQHDHKSVVLAARQMLIRASGGAVKDQGVFHGSFESLDARLLRVIPGEGHIGLVYEPLVFREVLLWISRSFAARSRSIRTVPGVRLAATAKGMALSILILPVVLLGWAGKALRPWSHASSSFLSLTPFSDFLVLMAAGLLALVWTSYGIPLRFLSLEEGEVIASLLFCSGVLAWLGRIAGRRTPVPRLGRQEGASILIGTAVAAGLYLLVAPFMTHELVHLEIRATRVWRFLALIALLLPFSLVTEGVFRGFQARRPGSWIGACESLLAGAFFFGLLSFTLFLLGDRIERFAPLLFGVAVYLQVIQSVLYARLPSVCLTAVFGSLVMSWVISVGFLVRG